MEKNYKGLRSGGGSRVFNVKMVVNAAGAWAPVASAKAGALSIPLRAYRRHLFISEPFHALDKGWPFVWDLSNNFYFRPHGQSLLLSACDKREVRDLKNTVKKELIDRAIEAGLKRKLDRFSNKFKSIKIQSTKSGLRTMAPDGRFVIGEDPKLKGFYWVAGLGGHGVTTCFAIGNLASDLILGRKREKLLVDALSPVRFMKK